MNDNTHISSQHRTSWRFFPGMIASALILACGVVYGDDSELRELETYTVTGSKTSRDLQTITESIAFTSAATIEELNLVNYPDVFRISANVRDSAFADGGFIIRGVNSDGVGGVSDGAPLATLYIDGIAQTQQASRRGAIGLWDVQQVEIFRGPQGTISGRNSLAGAMYVKTNDPTFVPEGAVRVAAGDWSSKGVAMAYSTPVSDDWAVRFAGYWNRQDSTIDYPNWAQYDQGDVYPFGEEGYQFRVKALYQPGGVSDRKLLFSYSHSYQSLALPDALGSAYDPLVNSVYDRVWRGFGYAFDVFFSGRRGTADNFAAEYTTPMGDNFTMTALATYTNGIVRIPSIAGANVYYGEEDEREYTAEVRWNYESEKMSAVFGVFGAWYDEAILDDRPIRQGTTFVRRDIRNNSINSDTAAVFGEVNYQVGDRLNLIAGARVNRYTRDTTILVRQGEPYVGTNEDFRIDVPFVEVSNNLQRFGVEETKFLPKIGLSYAVTDKQTVGFTIQEGWRNGGAGWDVGDTPAEAGPYTYDAESLWSLEFSYRSLWMEDRLRLNANVFYNDWSDMQMPETFGFNNPRSLTSNPGGSIYYGFEVDSRYRVTPELEFFAAVGYVRTKFDDGFTSTSGVDFSGKRFFQAPEWDVAGGINYRSATGFFATADFNIVSEYFSQIPWWPQGPDLSAGDYYTINATVGYQFNDRLSLTVVGRNLTDEDYMLYNEPFGDDAATLGLPRFIGIVVDGKF